MGETLIRAVAIGFLAALLVVIAAALMAGSYPGRTFGAMTDAVAISGDRLDGRANLDP
jgi:hypothetical protein